MKFHVKADVYNRNINLEFNITKDKEEQDFMQDIKDITNSTKKSNSICIKSLDNDKEIENIVIDEENIDSIDNDNKK